MTSLLCPPVAALVFMLYTIALSFPKYITPITPCTELVRVNVRTEQ
jgi:hypothetical protein